MQTTRSASDPVARAAIRAAAMRCTSRTSPTRNSERVSLATRPSPARRTTRRSPLTDFAGHRDRDVLEVVVGDGGERARAVEREPAQQRRVGAAADHDREAELAREADVLALLAVVDGDDADPAAAQQQRSRSPTWPSPTTTTWSRRGTARRPNSPSAGG